jgi:LacI family transcriptional regulator
MDKEAHTLEMLSNGTIDLFCQCLKKRKLGEYNHFSAIINDGTPIVMFDGLRMVLSAIRWLLMILILP